MSKFMTISAAALLAVSLSSAAFAQAGGNMNAPTPNSSGTGIVQPGTTSTGTAVDPSTKKGMTGTTGMNEKSGNGMMKDGSSKTMDKK